MELVTAQRTALREIRVLLGRFTRGEVEAAEFIPKYRSMFAPFDPPDLVTSDLTDAERTELALYIQFMGGWFGEDDALIPRRADWQYGKDTEPYSWIDEPEYRSWIKRAMADAGVDQ